MNGKEQKTYLIVGLGRFGTALSHPSERYSIHLK